MIYFTTNVISFKNYFPYNKFRIWEKGTNVPGNFGKNWEILITARWVGEEYPWKTIHFWKDDAFFCQKYIVFYAYQKAIHLTIVRISPIFQKFPSTLVPFSQIQIILKEIFCVMCDGWSALCWLCLGPVHVPVSVSLFLSFSQKSISLKNSVKIDF